MIDGGIWDLKEHRRLFRVSSSGATEYCSFRDHCHGSYVSIVTGLSFGIDSINGILYASVQLYNASPGGGSSLQERIVQITGLPTVLDIILSYQPPSTLSFNVPVYPEALPGADSFSVYSGDVATASDLSQASPLECTVPPDRLPVPGGQLSVPDTLPDPVPGDARYYLAAVNYQGQRRAGRQSVNGVLQGRNATALPGCP